MNNINFEQLLGNVPEPALLKELIRDFKFYVPPFEKEPRQHSKELDRILGFKIPRIEQSLLKKYRAYYKHPEDGNRKQHFDGTQTWVGLHPQVLQTPYSEIFHFLALLEKYSPKKLVDLGAGYGRVGIVMNSILPEASFLGYEILPDRLKEANRMFEKLGLENCEVIDQNILEPGFVLPDADVYFIYDFSDPPDLRVILKQLSKKLFKDRFFVVAKGEGVRSLIQLKFPEFWVSHGVVHQKEWSLYSSFTDLT